MVVTTALDRLAPSDEGRLAQVVGRLLQLGGVLLDPGEQCEPLEGVGQPAVAPLDLVDHRGQRLGHLGQRVHQWVAEESEQPGEDQHGRGQHHADGGPPAEAVPLEEVHRRIEHQGDEGGDEYPQDHLAQATEQPVQHPGDDDHGVDGQDGAQGHALGRGRGEQALPPGASGPTSWSWRSDWVSLITVGGSGGVTRLTEDATEDPLPTAVIARGPSSARPGGPLPLWFLLGRVRHAAQHVRSRGAGRVNMEVMAAERAEVIGARPAGRWWHRGPFVRREVRLSVGTVLVFLFLFYVALPLLASHRAEVNSLAHINLAYLALGVLLEIGALAAYTQLTHAVLPHRRADAVPPLPDQHVHPGPQPCLPRWDRPGGRPGLPAAHPVRGHRLRRRLRPRDPGHRLGGGPERDLLVLTGGRSSSPTASTSRPSHHGRPVAFGVDPGHRGRRRRRGPARRLRGPLLPADPGPGAGQPGHPPGGRPDPLPRRRPDHGPRRAAGPPVRASSWRTGR